MLPIILAIALLLGLIWWTRGRKVKNTRWGSNKTQESGFKQAIRTSRSPSAKVSGKLRRDLIRIAGNPQVAERLVTNLRIKNPGKPENWYWEKAIFDLERDRHY